MVNNNITKTPQEQEYEKIKQDYEWLAKSNLEMIYKYGERLSDGEIERLINRLDWKEKTQFKISEGWGTTIGTGGKGISYRHDRSSFGFTYKPIYLIELREKEIKEQKETFEKEIKALQKELKEAWSEGDTHIEAMRFGRELVETQTKKLEEELENEKDIVQSFVKRHAEKIVEFDKLQESWNEEHEKVRKETQKNTDKDEVIRQLKEEIYLNTKPLPKTPSKFRILKEKTKTKFKQFQQLAKKTKVKVQEFIARIEVKVK